MKNKKLLLFVMSAFFLCGCNDPSFIAETYLIVSNDTMNFNGSHALGLIYVYSNDVWEVGEINYESGLDWIAYRKNPIDSAKTLNQPRTDTLYLSLTDFTSTPTITRKATVTLKLKEGRNSQQIMVCQSSREAIINYDFSIDLSEGQTLYFKIIDENAVIINPGDSTLPYFRQLGELTIPDMVQYNNINYSVSAIDSNAFAGCKGLTQITIPSSIKSIGKNAFKNVIGLSKTKYLGTLQQWCTIEFGSASANPVYSSGNLFINGASVGVNSFSENITEIKQMAFAGLSSLSGSLSLPNTVTTLGRGAFYQCQNLTSVNLPTSLREIGYGAFTECTKITSVSIPDNVITIGPVAFRKCFALSAITLPRSVKYIGYGAFYDCSSLQTVVFNADSCSTGFAKDNLIYNVFGSRCTSLSTIIIGESVRVIPDYAFAFCKKITEIKIPDSVTRVGTAAFDECSILASVTLGNNLVYIADSAFAGCNQLWQINMRTQVPPSYGYMTFLNVPLSLIVNVPCEAMYEYKNNVQWKQFTINGNMMYKFNLLSNDNNRGRVQLLADATCENPQATVMAIANAGYVFSHWNDGNTDNPRQYPIIEDSELVAIFEIDTY